MTDLQEEEQRLRMARFIVDLNLAVLMQQTDLSLAAAFEIMRSAKKAVLNLFPDKEPVYDLIYGPRFRRIINERFVIRGGASTSAFFERA
jgi:hypothetical protein